MLRHYAFWQQHIVRLIIFTIQSTTVMNCRSSIINIDSFIAVDYLSFFFLRHWIIKINLLDIRRRFRERRGR